MNDKVYNDILEKAIKDADKLISCNKFDSIPTNLRNNINILIDNIDKNKSIIQAIVTSCIKKINNPEQDIRKHRTSFKNGYSARTLDTKITTPFFKKYFLKYSNKESAFLTLSIREKIEWSIKNAEEIKIIDEKVKMSFLSIIDAIENNKSAYCCLVYLFAKLKLLLNKSEILNIDTIRMSDTLDILNIDKIINMFYNHFNSKNSSRLPVIAFYSIYQELVKNVNIYKDKKLKPLNYHTSSDKHGYGDIEVVYKNNSPYEVVEIKHNIPIDKELILSVFNKTLNSNIFRYYILTTYKNSFKNENELKYIKELVLKIKKETKIDIIPNGIMTSLKYYLRFIDNYNDFLKLYTKNLVEDSKISSEINSEHINLWHDILKENNI